jgi:carbamoyltransferase
LFHASGADVATRGVAFYDKPFLKFERLLETYYAFAPRGLRSFVAAMPVWIKEKLLLKRLLLEELSRLAGHRVDEARLLFPEHHLSHAASAFYPSPFDESAILTIDGVGVGHRVDLPRQGRAIEILCEPRFLHSVGLLYSAFTYISVFGSTRRVQVDGAGALWRPGASAPAGSRS